MPEVPGALVRPMAAMAETPTRTAPIHRPHPHKGRGGGRSAVFVQPLPNESPTARGIIGADGSVHFVRHHAELPEASGLKRAGIRLVRARRTLHLEFYTVPTAEQVFTISKESASFIDFDVRHPSATGHVAYGSLPMAEVDALGDAVRAIFGRWGLVA